MTAELDFLLGLAPATPPAGYTSMYFKSSDGLPYIKNSAGVERSLAGNLGTVISFAITNANGFAGTVASPTLNPNLTLTCSLTGVLKANGTSLLVATGADLPAMSATVGGAVPTPPNDATKVLSGVGTWVAGAGSGTVTTLSVVSANGFAGTVANPTTAPAVTLTTSITGMLKGNGTAISAASAANDFVAPSNYASANGLTMNTGKVLGRATAGVGPAEEIATTGTGSAVLATSPTLATPLLGTPTSGALTNCTADGTNKVGYRNIPQNSQSAAYTTVAGDAGYHIYHPSADVTARTFTIDSNANVPYPIGTALTFVNDTSAGTVTIAITADTLVLAGAGSTGSRTLAASGMATAIKMTSTRWMISGTGLT